MTTEQFKPLFERAMRPEDSVWNFRLTNLPTIDVAYVYLVFDGLVQYRANLVMYQRGAEKEFYDSPDGKARRFPKSNWVIFTGPIIKAPYEIPMRGFQGFRYTKQVF